MPQDYGVLIYIDQLEPRFLDASTVKNKKEKKEIRTSTMAAFFKRGHSSTPKNAAIAQKNAALGVFYGPAYKTQL